VRRPREQAFFERAATVTRPHRSKAFWIGAAVALAGAFTGFISGTRAPLPERAPSPRASASSGRAPSYEELRDMRRGPNGELYAGAFDRLAEGAPPIFDPVEQTSDDKARTLEARARRRAYDGAPPTVPHATMQMGVADCLACHEKGARVAGRVAPRPSHERHEACQQCHVSELDPGPGAVPIEPPPNTFVGLASPREGERAWPGAPPTIPHSTLMRSRCDACHGVSGRLGIRSTHPWRESCTQCHAPSATLDQLPTAKGPEGT
jgi:cytochrome c-type protein NapB